MPEKKTYDQRYYDWTDCNSNKGWQGVYHKKHKRQATAESDFSFLFVECPICGRYETTIRSIVWKNKKDGVASYLYHNNSLEAKNRDYNFYYFMGKYEAFVVRQEQYPFSAFLSTEEVDAFYPKTFSDRIDKILLAIQKNGLCRRSS